MAQRNSVHILMFCAFFFMKLKSNNHYSPPLFPGIRWSRKDKRVNQALKQICAARKNIYSSSEIPKQRKFILLILLKALTGE